MYSHKKLHFDELLDFANVLNHNILEFFILVINKETKIESQMLTFKGETTWQKM